MIRFTPAAARPSPDDWRLRQAKLMIRLRMGNTPEQARGAAIEAADGDDYGASGAVTMRDVIVAERTLLATQAAISTEFFPLRQRFKGKRVDKVALSRLTRMAWMASMRGHFAVKKLARICDLTPRAIRYDLDEIRRIADAFPVVDEFLEGLAAMMDELVPLAVDAHRFTEWGVKGLLGASSVSGDSPRSLQLSGSASAERRRLERARKKALPAWTSQTSSPRSSSPAL